MKSKKVLNDFSVRGIIFNSLSEYFENFRRVFVINILWSLVYIILCTPFILLLLVSNNYISVFLSLFFVLIVHNYISFFAVNFISFEEMFFKEILRYIKLLKNVNLLSVIYVAIIKIILLASAFLYIFGFSSDSSIILLAHIAGFTLIFFFFLLFFASNIYYYAKINNLSFKKYLVMILQYPFRFFVLAFIYFVFYILTFITVIGLVFFPTFNLNLIKHVVEQSPEFKENEN